MSNNLPGRTAGPVRKIDFSLDESALASAFDQSIPSYLLDENYWFVEWNSCFEHVVASEIGLRLDPSERVHAEQWIASLENRETVSARSRKVFGGTAPPVVDTEDLVFPSKRYGRITFRKVASQVDSDYYRWHVALNICDAEKHEELWHDLEARLRQQVMWDMYSVAYDKLLRNFSPYKKLLVQAGRELSGSRFCADVGAGTGNSSLELLKDRGRLVYAIEPNRKMLQTFADKVKRRQKGARERLFVYKEQFEFFDEEAIGATHLDGCLMLNSLYTADSAESWLEKSRILVKPGGRLVISNPHSDTDVDDLLNQLEGAVQKKTDLDSDQVEKLLDLTRTVHKRMSRRIHRYTKSDLSRLVEEAGFAVLDMQDSYLNAVVLITAERRP